MNVINWRKASPEIIYDDRIAIETFSPDPYARRIVFLIPEYLSSNSYLESKLGECKEIVNQICDYQRDITNTRSRMVQLYFTAEKKRYLTIIDELNMKREECLKHLGEIIHPYHFDITVYNDDETLVELVGGY